jgi:transcriptional regulator with XRE-family HTH domain
MSLISKRLKLFIKAKGLKITNLEKEIGVSNSALARPLKEGKGIKTDTLEKLLAVLDVHPVWLCMGIGEMEIQNLDRLKGKEIKATDKEYIEEYGITEKDFSEKFGTPETPDNLSLISALNYFIDLPPNKQSEVKGIISVYLNQILKEVREVTEIDEEDLNDEKEKYKKDLINIKKLAESRIEQKRLQGENRELKNLIKNMQSNTPN